MQINITDEMIEKMVREQVKARVNQYFAQLNKESSFFMVDNVKNAIRACASEEVGKVINEDFVKRVCNDLAKTHLKDQIVESFTARICNAFEED